MLLDAAFLTVDGQRRVAASCCDWRGGCRRGGGLWRGRRVAGQLDGRHDVVCRFGRRRAFAVGDGDAARDVGFFAFVNDGAAGFAVRRQGEGEQGEEGEGSCGDSGIFCCPHPNPPPRGEGAFLVGKDTVFMPRHRPISDGFAL